MIVDAAEFQWSVDPKGYQWLKRRRPRNDPVLVPAAEKKFHGRAIPWGGGVRWYVPMEKAKLFYKLAKTDKTEQGIIEFANSFGLLGLPEPTFCYAVRIPGTGRSTKEIKASDLILPNAEPLSSWRREIDALSLAYECWEALRRGDPGKLEGLETRLLPVGGSPPSPVAWIIAHNRPRPGMVAEALYGLVSRGLAERISGVLTPKPDGSGNDLRFMPQSLIGAIWLQFAQAVANGRWTDCEYCGEPFRPKNQSARYCSDSHRQLAYQKRIGEKP